MKMFTIKVGERVVIPSWKDLKITVSRIFFLDKEDLETKFQDNAVRVMLELDWGTFGKSRVSMTDENKTWYRYTSAN
jgi:hypothetical protein